MIIFKPLQYDLRLTSKKLKVITFSNIIISQMFSQSCCDNSGSKAAEFHNVETDRFHGVTIKSAKEFCDTEQFTDKLKNSLTKWTCDGVRAVWFHILVEHSKWIPVLSENNFIFHRVSTCGKTVVMYRWLPPNTPDKVPPYSHTMVGVGAVVFNKNNELLTVLERYGTKEILKLPGGYLDPKEDLDTAAIREVEEETGIRTKFVSCLFFRHCHEANFGCSDLYFIVQLEPVSETIRPDLDEVVEAKWIPVNDFLQHPKVHELNRVFVRTYQYYIENNISLPKQEGIHPVTNRAYSMYAATIKKD